MATINAQGNIIASCPGCNGSTSTYEWISDGQIKGAVVKRQIVGSLGQVDVHYRLFRCAGCNQGGLGLVALGRNARYPDDIRRLLNFMPESKERLNLPDNVPIGIQKEFREGEGCLENNFIRAAAGMFRSVLDKTLRANGYKVKTGTRLDQQIDAATKDGVITESRRRRAHDEIRVLGNDVLHDEWHEIPEEDVLDARHYAQRILEDFYDDREIVLKMLREANRIPDEDKQEKSDTKADPA